MLKASRRIYGTSVVRSTDGAGGCAAVSRFERKRIQMNLSELENGPPSPGWRTRGCLVGAGSLREGATAAGGEVTTEVTVCCDEPPGLRLPTGQTLTHRTISCRRTLRHPHHGTAGGLGTSASRPPRTWLRAVQLREAPMLPGVRSWWRRMGSVDGWSLTTPDTEQREKAARR